MSATFTPPSRLDDARRALAAHVKAKRVGDRLPPIKQLARQLNVGESNLLAAMQELKRNGVVFSRKRVGTFVAQQLGEHRPLANKRIALLYQTSDDLIEEMVGAATAALKNDGADARVTEIDWERVDDLPGHTQGADVTLLFNPPAPGSWVHLPKLRERYVAMAGALVVVSTSWSRGWVGGFDFDLVTVDQEQAGRLAGERLRAAGHSSACYIGRRVQEDKQAYTEMSAARLRGFERGLGATLRPAHCIKSRGYSLLSGGEAFQTYMSMPNRPRAVFAATDELAVGFWVGAAGAGLTPGQDFDLIGVDGLALGRQQTRGDLSTVQLPAAEMGRTGAALISKRIAEPRCKPQTQVLHCRVREGITTRAVSETDA